MCDYSLHAVASRPAEVAEILVSTKFQTTTTRDFAQRLAELLNRNSFSRDQALRLPLRLAFKDKGHAQE
jgi:hypothetical protein